MATLVLTAVGTAVGGPIGGMIGSVIGQHIDRTILFAPKARHGPRLGDLAVQTSSYGTAIPKVFGRMRVAGCVIWSTDLIETRSTSGGGKGQPKLVSYTYSASFAVALSARPIRSVGRIWADGKLLRGVAGDFKAETGFRLHGGDEDQPVDPLIAAAEGEEAPAFRGISYALFEDLQLQDFGNRIPSLTFEVESEPEPVAIGAIAAELAEGAIVAEATPSVTGYGAAGDSVRSAIEALADVVPLSLADLGSALRLAAAPPPPLDLAESEERARHEIARRASVTVPDEVSLAYYDPARDFQTGLQRATSSGSPGRNADRRALAAALGAEQAKALAERRLAVLRAGRVSAKVRLGTRRIGLRPGDAIRLAGDGAVWKIARWTLAAEGLECDLVRCAGAALPAAPAANPGRAVAETDLAHGPTVLRLHDLPLGEAPGGQPLLFVAAAGVQPGWRRAQLIASYDSGASWIEAGYTAAPAVLGSATSALGAAGSTLFDDRCSVEVELLHEGMWLEQASDAALADGANLALIGRELVQFGRAEWLGGRRFLLSRLLRGRRGTEWAGPLHAAGEDFALIERDALVTLEAPAGSIGAEARISASGVGDGGSAATALLTIEGEGLRPPSPVHLRAERLANGDVAIRWVRRSRLGWSWSGGGGTPLGEEAEAYRLTIAGAGFGRSLVVPVPSHVYTATEQAADGAVGAITIEITQVGTHAVSRPTSTILE